MKKLLFFVFIPFFSFAQIPPGYYDATAGLDGYKLKSVLYNIISNKTISWNYDSDLPQLYGVTDLDKYYEKDNSYLDIYAENPTGPDKIEFFPSDNQAFSHPIVGAGAAGEGSALNREHIVPQFTFNSAYPMYSDLHFVVPADAKINQLRNFYPYGISKTTSANLFYTFSNTSKIGNRENPGSDYKGRVYEPIAEFRGDIARMILYFAVRYESKLSSFVALKYYSTVTQDATTDVGFLDGTMEHAFDPWFLQQLLQWNQDDPVSQREIDRNNEIYGIQKNRNPFIDHPEWVNLIWNQTLSTVAPQSPTVLTASKVSAYFVNLSWVKPSDASIVGYKIYQDGVEIGTSKNNSFTVDHLTPSLNYNFTVKSYNNSNMQSVGSNILPILTYTTDTYAKDLIITKYLEGTDNNKALEITNKTGHSVNLDSYSISIQFKRTAYYFEDPLQLEGEVADNETFVMMNQKANFSCYSPSQAKFVSDAPSLIFDGTNFLSLRYKSTTVDALGAFDANNFSDLENVSLYRLNSVLQPNSNFNIAEWEKNPADYCANLGNLSTSENAFSDKNRIIIYPNPITESQIFAKGLELNKSKTAHIFDLSGKLILSEKEPFRTKAFINVDRLKKGIYMLKIDNQSFKIIKK
ncbi:endonuclease [Halpernia frigidisoli]|nr:endonuclease [Halpernia frigidisoli]